MLGTQTDARKIKHSVIIAGNTYHLNCDEADGAPQEAAALVDRLIRDIMLATGCTASQASVLAALRLAQQHLGDQAKILQVLTTQLDQASW